MARHGGPSHKLGTGNRIYINLLLWREQSFFYAGICCWISTCAARMNIERVTWIEIVRYIWTSNYNLYILFSKLIVVTGCWARCLLGFVFRNCWTSVQTDWDNHSFINYSLRKSERDGGWRVLGVGVGAGVGWWGWGWVGGLLCNQHYPASIGHIARVDVIYSLWY